MKKINKFLLLSTLSIATVLSVTSCEEKDKDYSAIKHEQIGLCLSYYYGAVSRQPESIDLLNQARGVLFTAIDNVSTEGKYLGLGSIGAANDLFNNKNESGGIFESIARQPESFDKLFEIEKNTIDYIDNSMSDIKAEMVGYASFYLFEAVARQPNLYDKGEDLDFKKMSQYVNSSIMTKSDESALTIGYASSGFYQGCSRQPEIMEQMWNDYKSFIDALK